MTFGGQISVFGRTIRSRNTTVWRSTRVSRVLHQFPFLVEGSHELARINELMNGLEGESEDEDGKIRDKLRQQIFFDMFNSPASICYMENPVKPIETRSRTLFCIAMKFSGAAPSAEVVWGNDLAGPVPEAHILEMPWA
ncbi:hypothetical protein B0H13DRAFT_2365188 [Mycena leptocephala]|nr:hypothetical protein B0H13DRAFT_2365188 [Mycena leptocephala]